MQDFFKNLSGSSVLSRNEMKAIKGGIYPVGGGKCATTGEMCHIEGDVTYTCSTEANGECCCGHSAGDWTCYVP